MTLATSGCLLKALEWYAQSGIQEPSGGVARYHLLAESRNLPVSTEITGYAVSALLWGGRVAGSARSTADGLRAADFLVRDGWQPALAVMPFEVGDPLPPTYFFDCGIIVRGLLTAWRASGRLVYLQVARELGLAMGRDFRAGLELHPILALPSKEPWPYERRWSREPGCFLLKSALAWDGLAQVYPGEAFGWWFEHALARALETQVTFLPGVSDELKVMDRLHAYSYFLEALLARPGRRECRDALALGMARVAFYLREIGPRFERSDVCAQLLRVRLLADHLGMARLDLAAAEWEAARCAAHQAAAGDFGFGTRGGVALPYSNPVSTAFCMQAMTWWNDYQAGTPRPDLRDLI